MSHNFSQVPRANIERSSFDRSHGYKTTFDAGLLIPFYVDEALPGDTFTLNMTAFARLATPLKPIMDNMWMETFFFAVPNRLLWDNWQKFNGEQKNPGDSTDFLVPTIAPVWPIAILSMGDYFGLPISSQKAPNAFAFRAYNFIYNEWFRDQNLQDSVPFNTDDGPDSMLDYNLKRRGKRHDYFTSCLPWPQKGPAVDIPIGTSAPIVGLGSTVTPNFIRLDSGSTTDMILQHTSGNVDLVGAPAETAGLYFSQGTVQSLEADLSNATAATINMLRESFQIQKLYERDARGGTRYTEIIKSHFGVTSPDSRLQRPEYLGGGSTPVNVVSVPQTAESGTTPQGNLAAYGTSSLTGHGFSKSFTEHCTLIGLVCVRADLTYQRGLDRMWSRQTRWDYYWPALSHIGEQEVLNKEIFVSNTDVDDDVFGYQERYAEYRYKPSCITGKFRSTDPQSLDVWHLSQDFATLPLLGDQFIQEDPPIDRIIAVPSEPHFLFDSYINLRCARPMPTYAVPGLIDHF